MEVRKLSIKKSFLMNSIGFESLITTIFVLVNYWYQEEEILMLAVPFRVRAYESKNKVILELYPEKRRSRPLFALLEQQSIKAGFRSVGTSYKEARKGVSIA